MRLRFAAFGILVLILGCKDKPIFQGPNYSFQNLPEISPSQSVEVTFVDARPKWERRYYEGNVTFVPLENLRPSPVSYLTDAVAEAMDRMSDPPNRAELTLQSFRVVFSEEEKASEIEKQKYENNEGLQISSDDDNSIIGSVISTFLLQPMLLLGQVGFEKAYDQMHDALFEWGPKERHLKGPPRQVKEHYADGRTCDIRVTALVHWADGRSQKFDLDGLNTTDEINPAIIASCNLVGQKLVERIQNPSPRVRSKGPAQQPSFTAYSN